MIVGTYKEKENPLSVTEAIIAPFQDQKLLLLFLMKILKLLCPFLTFLLRESFVKYVVDATM